MWQRKIIDEKDFGAVIPQGMQLIKAGEPIAEQLRCVFQLENDPCIYMLPLLDYVDFRPEKKLVSLSVYQMVS